MKKSKLYIFIIPLLCSLNCATTSKVQLDSVDYAVLNGFLNHYKSYSILSTTINPKFNTHDFFELRKLDVSLLIHYNISLVNNKIKFEDIFDSKDITELNQSFKNLKAKKLKKEYFKDPQRIKSNKSSKYTRTISEPILSKYGDYAFVYSESKSDGELICMEIINDNWKPLFVSTVWRVD